MHSVGKTVVRRLWVEKVSMPMFMSSSFNRF